MIDDALISYHFCSNSCPSCLLTSVMDALHTGLYKSGGELSIDRANPLLINPVDQRRRGGDHSFSR